LNTKQGISVLKKNKYLIAWDRNGINELCDISSYEREHFLKLLENKIASSPIDLRVLVEDAMKNQNLHSEIWIFENTEEIDITQVTHCKKFVTENGKKVFP